MDKKVVLITGASSGIGRAAAEHLAEKGHTVYAAARRLDKMEPLMALGIKTLKMDVTKHDEAVAAINQVIEEAGRIDVLFNNAGFGLYGPVERVPLDEARYQFEVNIFGLADVTQLVVPHMRRQKSGTIINTSSMGGKIYTPLGAWYHATKHALEGWSDCLRLELKQFGIDVVIIEPGIIKTEFSDVVGGRAEKYSEDEVYGQLVKTVAAATEELYGGGQNSGPEVIAEAIEKAISAKRPKPRYVKGRLAKPFIALRGLVSDRLFDKIVMSQVVKRS